MGTCEGRLRRRGCGIAARSILVVAAVGMWWQRRRGGGAVVDEAVQGAVPGQRVQHRGGAPLQPRRVGHVGACAPRAPPAGTQPRAPGSRWAAGASGRHSRQGGPLVDACIPGVAEATPSVLHLQRSMRAPACWRDCDLRPLLRGAQMPASSWNAHGTPVGLRREEGRGRGRRACPEHGQRSVLVPRQHRRPEVLHWVQRENPAPPPPFHIASLHPIAPLRACDPSCSILPVSRTLRLDFILQCCLVLRGGGRSPRARSACGSGPWRPRRSRASPGSSPGRLCRRGRCRRCGATAWATWTWRAMALATPAPPPPCRGVGDTLPTVPALACYWKNGEGGGRDARRAVEGGGAVVGHVGRRLRTCRRRPTAQATKRPSGLNFADDTGFLKVKWCSSVRRSRLINRLRPSSSMESSSWPSGLMQVVRTCVPQPPPMPGLPVGPEFLI